MKKYLSLLLVTLLLFAFLVSCSTSQNGNNANSSDSGVAQDSTNQSETNIDSSTTDSSTQNTDLPTDSIKSDLFKKAYERNKVDGIKYYTALEIGAINSDLYENENYRIIDTYNDLNHLFSNAGAIEESVFENRFLQLNELVKMGAKITVDGSVAKIDGVKKLSGGVVTALDLRGGAALVIAGLKAEGVTVIENASIIERGYLNLENKLSLLGADIKKV